MGLPFLKPKQMAATIIAKVKPNGTLESKSDEKPNKDLSGAEALISAIHAKDAQAVMDALAKLDSVEDSNEK